MNDLLPSGHRIDRPAFERVIQRAAELHAREREIGEGLTEAELIQLGDEVGIPSAHLRQALLEERTRTLAATESRSLVWLAGPRRVAAERTIVGDSGKLREELHRWMSAGELLQVKRRYPDHISWERKEGTWASLKRSLGVGGRKYILARARDITGRVTSIDGQRCHVQLIADLSNTLNEYLVGSMTLVGGGAAATALALVIGVMTPVALVPAVLSAPIAIAVARNRRRHVTKLQVALEQVLDRLEHGDLDVKPKPGGRPPGTIGRIADELRKNLGVVEEDAK